MPPLRFDRDRALSFTHFTWLRFVDDKCFETAGALSYTTLVSLVPLTVAVFASCRTPGGDAIHFGRTTAETVSTCPAVRLPTLHESRSAPALNAQEP